MPKAPQKITGDSENIKLRAVEKALLDLKKQFGEGSVFFQHDNPIEIASISTGSIGVDSAIGIGGIPRGRITEIFGPESSGKTTLTLSIIAQAQRAGGFCAFIDTEQALDPTWAERIGVDLEKMVISQPNTGEEAFEIIGKLLITGAFDIIVLDSVAALAPRAEIEGDVGDSHVALQARLMSQSLRRLTATTKQTNTALVFTNQLRSTIGGFGFGPSETTPGGKALKYSASVRIDIRRIQSIKEKNEVVGSRTKVRIKKNKVAPPFRECEFDIMVLENGISRLGEILDYGVKMDIIEKRGAFYRYEDTLLGQGKSAAREYLATNPEFAMEVENTIRQELNLPKITDVPNYGNVASKDETDNDESSDNEAVELGNE